MRIATFNVQNLRLRKIGDTPHLDGAVDGDMDAQIDPALDLVDRRLTARVLARIDADVVVLQEVFDTATLDFFHDRFLLPTGLRPYPYRTCLPGNDGRGLNVAAISRIEPREVVSHASVTARSLRLENVPPDLANGPIFRRDCLMLDLGSVTLFACHFKAPYPDPEKARAVRRLEARAVRRLIENRFPKPDEAFWLVAGDLNEPDMGQDTSAVAPLASGFTVDLMDRCAPGDGWTYTDPDEYRHHRPDALLASPALARAFPDAVPRIVRAGMDPTAARAAGHAFDTVSDPRPHASDHAAVAIDFDGL